MVISVIFSIFLTRLKEHRCGQSCGSSRRVARCLKTPSEQFAFYAGKCSLCPKRIIPVLYQIKTRRSGKQWFFLSRFVSGNPNLYFIDPEVFQPLVGYLKTSIDTDSATEPTHSAHPRSGIQNRSFQCQQFNFKRMLATSLGK